MDGPRFSKRTFLQTGMWAALLCILLLIAYLNGLSTNAPQSAPEEVTFEPLGAPERALVLSDFLVAIGSAAAEDRLQLVRATRSWRKVGERSLNYFLASKLTYTEGVPEEF